MMTAKAHFYGIASAILLLCAASSSAQAQTNQVSYVSESGSGSACTRAVPCASVQTAINMTVSGGVLVFLDAWAILEVPTVNKSLVIRSEFNDSGPTITNPSEGVWFTVAAGANDVVTFEGMSFNGGGISFTSGQHLHIVGCRIINNAGTGERGIDFAPTGASKLSVTDTVISNYGLNTGGGITVRPASGGSARVNIERVAVNGNAFGIAFDGGSSNGINATIADSMIGGNAQDGIIATTSSAPIGVFVTNSRSVNNAFGIRSLGSNVTVRVDGSRFVGNSTGLSFGSGGALLSSGGNTVQANSNNGSFSGSFSLQ